MPRRKILLWHIHGSYLNALTRVEHDWYLPVKPGAPEGYRGRGGYDLPGWVQDVPAEHVGDIDLDLIIYQTSQNLTVDARELLWDRAGAIPSIYLEHNSPRPHPVDS